MNNKIVVGITQGDSNSISYEVIIKALSDTRIFDICTPVIYGSSKLFGMYKKSLPDMDSISTNIINSITDAHPKRINIINCVPDNCRWNRVTDCRRSKRRGTCAEAAERTQGRQTGVIVTGPS